MSNMDGHVGTITSRRDFDPMRATGQPIAWRTTTNAEPHKISDFKTLLLAIAGHDLRQPLQIIQSTHELLGIGLRTQSELRLLRSGQTAINRLTEQLEQLIGAFRLCEHAEKMKLSPVRLDPLLRQACDENEEAALQRGIEIRSVPTSALVISDALLLGTVLRNLISNAVRYTQPGGRILVGCRHSGQDARIDVFDTGSGIADEHQPKIFDAFTRLDPTRRDGLGIGLFIVRQAIGMLGHRVDVSSVVSQGSRFSIFARRAWKMAK